MPRRPAATPQSPDWQTLLHASGLRVTPATVTVLGILHQAPAALTHEELFNAYARCAGAPPDKVTLYRILDRLVSASLCDKLPGTDRVTRFTLHANTSGHVFECSSCHKLLPLPDDPELPAALDRLGKALKRRGIQTSESSVTLRGTCSDCAHDHDGNGSS